MEVKKARRKLSNVSLDAKWHQRYLGAWIALTFLPIVALNLSLYHLYSSTWNIMFPATVPASGGVLFQHTELIVCLIVETLLFGAAIFFLAIMTGHRITGPRQKLLRTFREIKDGNHNLRLRFREKDELNDLAQEFNEMLETLLEGNTSSVPEDSNPSRLHAVGE